MKISDFMPLLHFLHLNKIATVLDNGFTFSLETAFSGDYNLFGKHVEEKHTRKLLERSNRLYYCGYITRFNEEKGNG